MTVECPSSHAGPAYWCRTVRGHFPGSLLPGRRDRFHAARLTASFDVELVREPGLLLDHPALVVEQPGGCLVALLAGAGVNKSRFPVVVPCGG